jgi:hypothetical protein
LFNSNFRLKILFYDKGDLEVKYYVEIKYLPKRNFYDKSGQWNFRIDATTHGNPKFHHDPHIHYYERDVKQGGFSKAVKYFWEIIKEWFSK